VIQREIIEGLTRWIQHVEGDLIPYFRRTINELKDQLERDTSTAPTDLSAKLTGTVDLIAWRSVAMELSGLGGTDLSHRLFLSMKAVVEYLNQWAAVGGPAFAKRFDRVPYDDLEGDLEEFSRRLYEVTGVF
jgi:hypothetical protein